MRGGPPDPGDRGSILLPVIAVLLLIASAATAMTIQARTSLREAATRRDRLALSFMADAVVRAAALALGDAVAGRTEPPFGLDGTPQACALPGGGLLVLSVQDEGGLVDLNTATRDLLLLVLQRAGLSGFDAKGATDAILRRRDAGQTPARPTSRRTASEPPRRTTFASVDEIDALPGIGNDVFERLRPALSISSGSSGFDPTVAGLGLRMLIPAKELAGPVFSAMATPSTHTAFTVTGTAVAPRGTRVQRRATMRLSAETSRFTTWESPVSLDPLTGIASGAFCQHLAVALRS